MGALSVERTTMAKLNFLIISAEMGGDGEGFAPEEIVELFEVLMPGEAHPIEPVRCVHSGEWYWQAVSRR